MSLDFNFTFEEDWENVPDDEGGRRTNETGKAGRTPGEQQGNELSNHAKNRSRNSDGQFIEEDNTGFLDLESADEISEEWDKNAEDGFLI